MFINPSGFFYGEYYLYSDKNWQFIPSGVSSFITASGIYQNAPVIVTSSGMQESQPQDAWARYDGPAKYTKVGFGGWVLNDNDVPDPNVKQFAMHPNCSGMIVFGNPLTENVSIEYESGTSPYYTMSSIDLNPMRSEFNSGFISFSPNTNPVSINMNATNTLLTSDGAQKTNILATVLDQNNDVCSNQTIIFNMTNPYIAYLEPLYKGTITQIGPSGYPVQITAVTNGKGQARVVYWPIYGQSGSQAITATWSNNSSVFGYVVITQSYTLGNPFSLDSSLMDSTDYLT